MSNGEREILERIKRLLANIEIDKVPDAVKEALDKGIPPLKIINEALAPAMEIVGKKFEEGEYFLAELVAAGETFKEVLGMLRPLLLKSGKKIKRIGKVVIGTVRGDLHDIGKNIVATMLESAGFEVYDLGADVPPEEFVKKAKEVDADIVAMSALLTTTMIEMKNVIEELKKAGIRDKVKVIVGGAPVTEEFAREIGADAYAEDAVKAVEVCKRLIEEKRKKS
ncbi:MAG: cobalamin-binding protein [Thermoprotei archaeon]|nr:MAG: cobalamin-binding protein [Thermoprotei archaeon]